MQGGMVSNRLQRDMNPRDAVIRFHCSSTDFVLVSEIISGERVRHQEVRRDLDIVTEVEERYIFFAKQADTARRNLRLRHSCVFSVYFREP
jgi:hypothetical protein